ncbi:unnamed protein product [Urochloa decumbens]|uniref:Glycosyltransferase n=1 Tax=Urochloa decumbens TaxID=240449 RepID=A0ABC9B1U7_9POAL
MDTAAGSPPPPLRIVLCPWLAFGHMLMLPYFELAERLASRGHRVSFVSTPRNLARLPPLRRLAAAGAHGGGAVDLVPLTLPRVDGLPDGAESTNDVPGDRLEPLWEAFDALAAPFAEYLAAVCTVDGEGGNSKPDWVLADTFHHWAPLVAGEHGIPCAMLLPTAAMIASLSCGARDHVELAAASVFEHPIAAGVPPPAIPRYEWHGNTPLFAVHGGANAVSLGSGMSIARRASLTLEQCAIAAMRSCPEWEPGKFRAVVPLRVQLVHELAHGLELAGTRFLWALRKPRGVADADVLPAGFLERTKGHGLVTMGWVPQISILAHGAVGAFLTHCGRNSLIEGLLYGHPLIMLPIFGDQGPNSRLMAGRKVGLMVARNEDDGSFDRHGITSAVKGVMVEEDTRRVSVENAKKMQEIVADKELQEWYVDEYVLHLRSFVTDHGNSSAVAAPRPAEI